MPGQWQRERGGGTGKEQAEQEAKECETRVPLAATSTEGTLPQQNFRWVVTFARHPVSCLIEGERAFRATSQVGAGR
jgi:hypothetical protein